MDLKEKLQHYAETDNDKLLDEAITTLEDYMSTLDENELMQHSRQLAIPYLALRHIKKNAHDCMDHEAAMKELEEKVLKIMDELQDISMEYCNWDEWDKSRCVDKASGVLFEKYEEANFNKHVNATDQ